VNVNRKFPLFFLLLALSAASPAEDFCCGSIFPVTKTSVRLSSEDVKLRLQGGQVDVDCAYGLENTGDAVVLDLGLPYQAGAKAGLGIGEDEPDSIDAVDIQADGNPVESVPGPGSGPLGTAAYFWSLSMDAHVTVDLRVSYSFTPKTDDDGVSHLDFVWDLSQAWSGAEGAELDIDLGRPFPPCYLDASPAPQSYENGHLHWSRAFAQAREISVSLDQKCGDLFAAVAKKAEDARDLGADEALMLKNTIFALRGKVFKSRSLNRHFVAQDWYKPKQDYSDKLLTSQEWDVVAALSRKEAAARGQKVPKN
jgi:hypothetical protein